MTSKRQPKLISIGKQVDGDRADTIAHLGALGATLASFARLGLTTPAAVVVTPEGADALAEGGLAANELERELGQTLRDTALAVRPSPTIPVKGAVETRLNVRHGASLCEALRAVTMEWSSPRAKMMRGLHGAADAGGLPIVVQAMVQGSNLRKGVAALRNPATGEPQLWGEIQSPDGNTSAPLTSLSAPLQQILRNAVSALEAEWRDAAEVEFILNDDDPYFVGAQPARRTMAGNLKILASLVAAGRIREDEALLRVNPFALDQLLHATIDETVPRRMIAQGLAASPGAATGIICFNAADVRHLINQGHSVILVRTETAPEDIKGLHLAAGVITTRGGMTSHAAVIARGMGKPCVVGATSLKIEPNGRELVAAGRVLKAGDAITVDGSSGQVLDGLVPLSPPSLSGDFATVLGWADKHRRMKVRANAETAHDARLAKSFGAEGIGLARAEHMFFEGERIRAIRAMILADSQDERRAALEKILPVLRADFAELFSIMSGLPVTIRLLDPPLHEFLPRDESEIEALAAAMQVDAAGFKRRVLELREQNPMLGHRGVRLLLSFPEITDMQSRAIFEAAAQSSKETGKQPRVEIMVPLVADQAELQAIRNRIEAVARAVTEATGAGLHYNIGTMIELPRAALKAGGIAKSADFFSFGTNDLTQTTYGISRDDSGRFIGEYMANRIFASDPFVTLDTEGVGELISLAIKRGRDTRPDLLLGICGEHGGDPDSIAFFEKAGLDYVSCSPYRVPVARLAAAQSHLNLKLKYSKIR